jgi:hypothetical protein
MTLEGGGLLISRARAARTKGQSYLEHYGQCSLHARNWRSFSPPPWKNENERGWKDYTKSHATVFTNQFIGEIVC